MGNSLSSSETVYAVITEIILMGFELEGDVECKIILKNSSMKARSGTSVRIPKHKLYNVI